MLPKFKRGVDSHAEIVSDESGDEIKKAVFPLKVEKV